MKKCVDLTVRSSVLDDRRKISIRFEDYPFEPQVGSSFSLPSIGSGMIIPQACVRDVVYPVMANLGRWEAWIVAELDYRDFEALFEFLSEWRDGHEGRLTHQWENWRISDI